MVWSPQQVLEESSSSHNNTKPLTPIAEYGDDNDDNDCVLSMQMTPVSVKSKEESGDDDGEEAWLLKVLASCSTGSVLDERRLLSERMSFQPWHARVEHKPLGGGQVARGIIYSAMSDFRRKRRGIEPYEPHPED